MASAFRSFFTVLATHVLAGAVDTTLTERPLLHQLWWLARYFNPLNLGWRYYSILAYRLMAGKLDNKRLALINFECFPFDPPIPYIAAEKLESYVVKRLEISGVISSQGLLSFLAAYQGILAIQFTISTSGFGYLPNITKAMAILGLMRVMVSHWIANKIHVEVEAYPWPPQQEIEEYRANKILATVWLLSLFFLVILSMRSYIPYPPSKVPTHLIDRSIEFLYNYISVSAVLFHAVFLHHGPRGLGNRHLLFDHWLYQLQTAMFLVLLTGTVIIGVIDFIHHDYYRFCA